MRTSLFVYGSLKRGGRLHHYLDGQPLLPEASLRGFRLHGHPGVFPYMVEGDEIADNEVHGEVYSVDARCLYLLDAIERGAGYSRVTFLASTATVVDGVEVEAYLYPYSDAKELPVVPDGRWPVGPLPVVTDTPTGD